MEFTLRIGRLLIGGAIGIDRSDDPAAVASQILADEVDEYLADAADEDA